MKVKGKISEVMRQKNKLRSKYSERHYLGERGRAKKR